jgi:hypothetical protein
MGSLGVVDGAGLGSRVWVLAGLGFGAAHWENKKFGLGDLGDRNLEKRSVAGGQGPGDVQGVFGCRVGEVW